MSVLFGIDSTTPHAFRKRGKLRPAVEAVCASLIMYYETRHQKGEMASFQARHRDSWARAIGGQISQPHHSLIAGGKLIRVRFDADNLRLTSPPTSIELTLIIRAIKQLNTTLKDQAAATSTSLKTSNCNFAWSSGPSRGISGCAAADDYG